MLTDSHAHLDFPDFADDFSSVLERAEAAGIARIISIGTTLESCRSAVTLAEQHAHVFATAGLHPSHAEEAPKDAVRALREIAKHPRVVAIGEVGLDYHRLPGETPDEPRNAAYKARQAALFKEQLDLAVELDLNAVIHQRDAWDDTLAILKPYTGKLQAVFHCFGESLPRARQLLAHRTSGFIHRHCYF